jgi:sulfoxide reductase heme-binding subunit YedZ
MVLLIVLSATVVLGILASKRWKAEGWQRFITSDVHRNLSLLGLVLLALHGLTVIADSYAHLGLRDITIPFSSAYRQLWLGLGVLAGELMIGLVAVSLLRRHLGYGLWKLTHWSAYAAWPLALLHGLGTGSDAGFTWALVVYTVCSGSVLLAVLLRLSLHLGSPAGWRIALGGVASAGLFGVAIWAMLGPLQPGWAAAAGTPPSLLGSRQADTGGPSVAAPGSPGSGPASGASTPGLSPTPTPGGSSAAAAIPAGLDDQLEVRVSRSDAGQQLTFGDLRDPSLQIAVLISGGAATSGPLEVKRGGQVVCQTQADLGQGIDATCGGTQLVIQVFRSGRGLRGELTTNAAP